MNNSPLSHFVSVLIILLFSNILIAQTPLNINSSMITDEGNSDPTVLFDGDNSTYWFAGWNTGSYPAFAYIDFGQPTEISKIDLFDSSGNGEFKIYTGTPGNWNPTPIVNDSLNQYLNWNEHSVNVTTQYIRLEMITLVSRVGEIKIYATSSGNSPVWNPIDDIVMTGGNSLPLDVSAINADTLSASSLPSFVSFTDNGNGMGTFSINPSEADTGVYSITTIASGNGETTDELFSITVESTTPSSEVEIRYEIISTHTISNDADITNLFDEQITSGDPRNGPAGNPSQYWFAGWDASNYPAVGYADLGEIKQLTRIFIRDINGEGSFKIFTGSSPSNWDSIPIIDDGLNGYLTWNEHPLNLSTRYIRFEIENPVSNVAEVLIYGTGIPIIDTIPPAAINDLTVSSTTYNSLTLEWTATGDDDQTGTANTYDLRYSLSPINDQNFDSTTSIIISNPQISGSIETAIVQDLDCDTTYYFAIKAIDEVNHVSTISNMADSSTASCPTADITVVITFDSLLSSTPIVTPARLRFNKDFAFSLSFDDGSPETYLNTFPIMSGGTSENGDLESGAFYTDGCGNYISFRGAISINGWHIHEQPNEAYVSWEQVHEMYSADWDILNHGYRHCAYDSCDYDAEVYENVNVVQNEIGFTMTHFVVPSGDDQGYRIPAFENGMLGLHDQDYTLPGYDGLKVDDPVDLFQFQLHRNSLEFEIPPYKEDIDLIANKSTDGNHFWFSEYGHKVGNPGEPYIGITMDDFRDYMIYLEDSYGRDGSDRIWVAPVQEVYEYIWVRDHIIPVSSELNNNQLTVTYSLDNIPNTLRRYVLSLVVELEENRAVSNVEVTGASAISNSDGLINLSW